MLKLRAECMRLLGERNAQGRKVPGISVALNNVLEQRFELFTTIPRGSLKC